MTFLLDILKKLVPRLSLLVHKAYVPQVEAFVKLSERSSNQITELIYTRTVKIMLNVLFEYIYIHIRLGQTGHVCNFG